MRKVEVLESQDGRVVLRETDFINSRADVSFIHLEHYEAQSLAKVLLNLEDSEAPAPQIGVSLATKKVDLFFVEEAGPDGKRVGVQCSACPERFFDRLSEGPRSRLLESGIPKAIEHARRVHQSDGGVMGTERRSAVGTWALMVTVEPREARAPIPPKA